MWQLFFFIEIDDRGNIKLEKKRSLGVNFIFNMMRTMMGVIIPLITFPYSSRVLGPEALGKVDYAQANMTYFTLLQARLC